MYRGPAVAEFRILSWSFRLSLVSKVKVLGSSSTCTLSASPMLLAVGPVWP
jgi:hypothetical protein